MAIERREQQRESEHRESGKSLPDSSGQRMFGLEVDSLGSKAQIGVSLAVIVPVAVGFGLLFAFQSWLWWLVFVFGWSVFPAAGLFVKGVAGLLDSDDVSPHDRERELLEALYRNGEATPAQAAMETSLTVKEADEMTGELASGGHLEVRVRGGAIFYSLWSGEDGPGAG